MQINARHEQICTKLHECLFLGLYMRHLFVTILIALSASAWSQVWHTKITLTDSLMVQTPGGWSSLREVLKKKSAWLILNTHRYRGDYVVVQSSKPFYLFIEGKLAGSGTHRISWAVDSLRGLFGEQWLRLNLYQPQGIQPDLQVSILTPLIAPLQYEDGADKRPDNPYRDFLLSALVLALIILLVMTRINRLLVVSYLDVSSLLSFREGGDHPMYNRVTNTTNLILLILVAFIYSVLFIQPETTGPTFSDFWYSGLKNSVTLGMLMLVKGLLIFLLSALFNISAWKGLQYIGFVRYLLLFGLILLGIQVAGVFIFSSFYLKLVSNRLFFWILGMIWLILIWGKLRTQTRFSAIHLFSYLCATEIGPLLLTATANWKV